MCSHNNSHADNDRLGIFVELTVCYFSCSCCADDDEGDIFVFELDWILLVVVLFQSICIMHKISLKTKAYFYDCLKINNVLCIFDCMMMSDEGKKDGCSLVANNNQ